MCMFFFFHFSLSLLLLSTMRKERLRWFYVLSQPSSLIPLKNHHVSRPSPQIRLLFQSYKWIFTGGLINTAPPSRRRLQQQFEQHEGRIGSTSRRSFTVNWIIVCSASIIYGKQPSVVAEPYAAATAHFT